MKGLHNENMISFFLNISANFIHIPHISKEKKLPFFYTYPLLPTPKWGVVGRKKIKIKVWQLIL